MATTSSAGPLADITLLGGAYAILRRHNCHAQRCWRIGRHLVPGTTYVVCHKHNPEPSPTADQIVAAHAAHRNAMEDARASAAATVHDATKVAREVAADVHEVAEDVHETASRHRPPGEEHRE